MWVPPAFSAFVFEQRCMFAVKIRIKRVKIVLLANTPTAEEGDDLNNEGQCKAAFRLQSKSNSSSICSHTQVSGLTVHTAIGKCPIGTGSQSFASMELLSNTHSHRLKRHWGSFRIQGMLCSTASVCFITIQLHTSDGALWSSSVEWHQSHKLLTPLETTSLG